MSVSVGYASTEPISPALQSEINAAAWELSNGMNWIRCEPPFFGTEEGFAGSSKIIFQPCPEELAAAESEGQPIGTLRDLLEILCELSRRFDVDWELSDEFGDSPLGYIRLGVCDADVRAQWEVFSDLRDEDFDYDELSDDDFDDDDDEDEDDDEL